MFKPIKRANRSKKFWMKDKAEDIAEENGWKFTVIEPYAGSSSYTAEFFSDDSSEPFYGWVIISTDGEEQIDFVFGPGQQVFDDARYITTEEDYFETIGAGI